MNEVTLRADATTKPVDGGVEIAVSSGGRALAAVQRMVPASARAINALNGWSSKATPISNGEMLAVTSGDPK